MVSWGSGWGAAGAAGRFILSLRPDEDEVWVCSVVPVTGAWGTFVVVLDSEETFVVVLDLYRLGVRLVAAFPRPRRSQAQDCFLLAFWSQKTVKFK